MLKKDKLQWMDSHVLPGLIKLIKLESSYEAFNTLGDVVTFLLIYGELIKKEKPAKRISVLGTLVDIVERILDRSSTYKAVICLDYRNDDETTIAEPNFLLKIVKNSIKNVLDSQVFGEAFERSSEQLFTSFKKIE